MTHILIILFHKRRLDWNLLHVDSERKQEDMKRDIHSVNDITNGDVTSFTGLNINMQKMGTPCVEIIPFWCFSALEATVSSIVCTTDRGVFKITFYSHREFTVPHIHPHTHIHPCWISISRFFTCTKIPCMFVTFHANHKETRFPTSQI